MSAEVVQRSTVTGTAIILATVTALSAYMVTPKATAVWFVCVIALLGVLAVAARSAQAVHLALFSLLSTSLPLLSPTPLSLQLNLIISLAIYAIIVRAIPSLRRSVLWLRVGRLSSDVLLLAVVTIVVSGLALVCWYFLLRPDLSPHLTRMPRMPIWVMPFAALGFAVLNAALEEIAFRGIMMQALDSAIGAGSASIAIQAVSFGLLHFLAGFPGGWWGLAMTTGYGLMLGVLRRRSQGIFAPWMAHVLADVVIFCILAAILVSR